MNQRTQIAAYFFFTVFLYVLYQLIRIFSPFFQGFFWAAVVAFAFYPMHKFFVRATRGRTIPASVLSTLSIVIMVIAPGFMVLESIIRQSMQLYQWVVNYINQGKFTLLVQHIQSFGWFQAAQTKLAASEPLQARFSEEMLKVSQYLTNSATTLFTEVTKNIFFISLNIILMVILLFVFFLRGENMYRYVYSLVPMDDADRKALAAKINLTFAGVIRGQFLTSLIQSLLAGGTYFFLGFEAYSLFGLATFMTSLVPFLGASAVWLPTAIYLFLTEQMQKGVILSVIGIFVISMSDNVIKPILVSEKTKIPVFLLFLGILGAMQVYGLTGIFLGPVFIAVLFALIEIYKGRYQ